MLEYGGVRTFLFTTCRGTVEMSIGCALDLVSVCWSPISAFDVTDDGLLVSDADVPLALIRTGKFSRAVWRSALEGHLLTGREISILPDGPALHGCPF